MRKMGTKYVLVVLLGMLVLLWVLVSPVLGAPSSIVLTAEPQTVVADGVSYSKVRALLLDESSLPVVGAYVNFSIGNMSLLVKTNLTGIATAKVGPSETIQSITVTGMAGGLAGLVIVDFVAGMPEYMLIYPSPSAVGTRDVTGNNTAGIYVRIFDAYRNPVTQNVSVAMYLKANNGSISSDYVVNPPGVLYPNGTIIIGILPNINGESSLLVTSRNTSGTIYIEGMIANLNANSSLKILGESYLVVETNVSPKVIAPPAVVNVTITVSGGGEKVLGGLPVDVILTTDISGSMDPDYYNAYYGGEQTSINGTTGYVFNANSSVPAGGLWGTFFYLNESVNDLWFKLNTTDLNLSLISPSGNVYGYSGGSNNSPSYMYSKNYPGSVSPEWIWFKPYSPSGSGNYLFSPDNDFPEKGKWEIQIRNPGATAKPFNITTYIEKLSAARIAAKTFNTYLNPDFDRIGLVSFGNSIATRYNLTSNISNINSRIDSLYAYGNTPTAKGLNLSTRELVTKKRDNVLMYIILLSDGQPNVRINGQSCGTDTTQCERDAVNESNIAKAKGIRVFSIGIGVGANETVMRRIASENGYYYAANSTQLKEIYGDIAKQITNISAKKASLNITLLKNISYSANATYLSGSARQRYVTLENITYLYECADGACEPNNAEPLQWDIKTPHPDNTTIKIGDVWTLDFQLLLNSEGMLFDTTKSIAEYVSYTGSNITIYVPNAKVSKIDTLLNPAGLNVSKVLLNANRYQVKANGINKAVLTATVLDEEDNLVPDGTEVVFQTSLGTFREVSYIDMLATETIGGMATTNIYSRFAGRAYLMSASKAEKQIVYIYSEEIKIDFAHNKRIQIS